MTNETGVRIQCSALTKAGAQCKNYSLEGSEFCRVHLPSEEGDDVLEAEHLETLEVAVNVAEESPDATDEQDLRKQLSAELDRLIDRVRVLTPEYSPPPFSPRRLLRLISENLQNISPEIVLGILEKLRSSIGEDIFDIDTWKGVWYMLNYTLEYQGDILRRRTLW